MTDTPTTDTQTKLDAIRARRAELAAAAELRLEPSPDEALAIEERALKADEALDAAQREHGPRAVRMVRLDSGDAVILRRPHIASYRKFQDSGEVTSETSEQLVKSSLIYPSKPEFDKLMTAAPGVLIKLANTCVELAGFRVEYAKGK